MDRPAAFSAASVIGDLSAAAVAALDRLGNERGLSEGELAQLGAFEALQAEARAVLPLSRSMFLVNGSTAALLEQLGRCAEATAIGVPLVELLGMRGAVPGDWHHLPLNLDTVLWFGVTRFADDLSQICTGGLSSARRQEQLAAVRDLQGALGRVIRISLRAPPLDRDRKRATAGADDKFTRATNAIGDDLPAIRAEAAAIRARP